MRGLRIVCALSALFAIGAIARPQAGGSPWSGSQIAALRASIDRALEAPELRGANVGFFAVDTERGSVLYDRNADHDFVPASSFKLLVGSAALNLLGPNFTYVTRVFADVPPVEGVVAGNLYLRGGGDARLSVNDLLAAAATLARAGVRRVDGALITDATHDDDDRFGSGWTVDDLPYEYGSPISALELEDGIVHVFVSPGAAAGAPVKLRVEPASAAFSIVNHALTGARNTPDTTDVVRRWDAPRTIEIVGAYPEGAPESGDLEPSAPDPPSYAGDVLLQALQADGISVRDGVRAGAAPPGAVVLWSHASPPLSTMLAQFWLPSDNLMGDLLVKELGAMRSGEPGTFTSGIAAEREYLRSIGFDLATLSIVDGSGHSAYDRLTPRDLVTVLQSDWNGPQRVTVTDALPQSGVRGTLESSFTDGVLAGRIFAKTGSHRHGRALAGFLQTGEHGPVTFALLINDWLGDERPSGSRELVRAERPLFESFLRP